MTSRTFFGALLLLALTLAPAVLAQGDPLVGDWYVSVVNENGEVQPHPHPVPWTFEANGKVHSGNLWVGRWNRKADRVYDVSTISGNGVQDSFELVLDTHRWFTCIQAGQVFRVGRR